MIEKNIRFDGGLLARAKSMRIGFSCIVAAVFILMSAHPARAILPEKQSDSYLKLSDSGRAILPGRGQFIERVNEVSGDKIKRTKALNTSKSWRRFAEKAGPGWYVRWNTTAGTPHLAAGKPLQLPPWRQVTNDNVNAVCMGFVSAYSDLLAVEPSKLRPVRILKAGGRWHATYEQIHNNVPVYGSMVYMALTDDAQLTAFGSDVFPDIDVDTNPAINQQQALKAAIADCKKKEKIDRISDVTLCILPDYDLGKPGYLLCWKLEILQSRLQKKWQYFINARNGEIVNKRNTLWYANVTGTVGGEYKPEFAADPTMVGEFAYENVTAEGQEKIIKAWDFNSDPGWTMEGAWAFGKPLGSGSGCDDPSSAYTGENVYGYNLAGNYKDNEPAANLTTTAVDCSDYENIRLKFMRWLGVELDWFDQAAVEVSNNGVDWVPVWTNPDDYICDGKWVSVSYDISSVAAHQPAVYVRWVMGPTDQSITFPGWNIDDVQIVEVQGGAENTNTKADGQYKVKLPWKNSTVISELKGLYCDINYGVEFDSQFAQPDIFQHDITSWIWDSSLYNVIDESNVYWHINHIHDYYKQLDRDFNGLDYPVPARVYVDFSNAYWDGVGMAFGRGDGYDFDDFGLYAEVIYHEYTHGVTDKIYSGVDFPYAAEPGAMNEGWSDYFACALSPSQSPKIGEGGLIIFEPNGFRTLDNTYRRETDWVNEVHADSEMFGGALWEAREVLGADIMDSLVHFARYAHAMTFEDYLMALLIEDASRYHDKDLSDGTPHCQAIFTAFGHHGIGGLQYLGPSIVVNDTTGNHNGRLDSGETGKVSLTLLNGWANAKNVSAIISSDDPFVNITRAKAVFGNINYGAMGDNSADPFVISISPDCPETHTVHFTLTVTAEGPYSYKRECLLYYNVAVQQLAYDDGQPDELIYYGAEGGMMAVRMTPDIYPCYPTHVRLGPAGRSTITLMVWDDDDPNGLPGTVLGTATVHTPDSWDWFDVDIRWLGLKIDSGSIYVGWAEGPVRFLNGFDNDPPYYERTVVHDGRKWHHLEEYGYLGNLMTRLRFANEPPLRILPPYEYAWCHPGEPVSVCLNASGGTPPYHNWVALPLPPTYSYGILDSSLFASVGVGQNWHDDDFTWSYNLPFNFPYYGTNYNRVNISSNGFLDFLSTGADFDNTTLRLIYNVRIAPLWDDLATGVGDIFIDESISGQVTIRWQAGGYQSLPVNFAVVLFDDGRIRFDYGQTNNHLSPTVGISKGNGADYIIVSEYDFARSLTNAKSVLFSPVPPRTPLSPGVTLDSATGCLTGVPDTEGTYNVTFEVEDSSVPPQTTRGDFVFNVGQNPVDLDGDCGVNLADFSVLAGHWLNEICTASNNWCGGTDFDDSGRVDMDDLAVIADYWLDGVN